MAFSRFEMHIQIGKITPSPTNHRPLDACFRLVWKAAAITKAKLTAWRLLWNRLPTNDVLSKKIILDDGDLDCAVCDKAMESTLHVFLRCEEGLRFGAC